MPLAKPESQTDLLIVGAGPTGLTAGIELARRGILFRIIEKRTERPPLSKALGVNPRTLELLEASGVTPRLLAAGHRMEALHAFASDRQLFQIELNELAHRYPFMLILPQVETEKILENRLQEFGVAVETGTRLESLTIQGDDAVCELTHDSHHEQVRAHHVLGTDGAHSTVRTQCGIGFTGTAMDPEWSLADIHLGEPWPQMVGNVRWSRDRLLVILPIDKEIVRLFSDRKDFLNHLPTGIAIDEIQWQSSFRIEHRIADTLKKGPVCLAGDAAHIHSPLGARGMNLGIEDACAFANSYISNTLDQYAESRRAKDAKVVARVERFTRMAANHSPAFRALRKTLGPVFISLSPIRHFIMKTVTGLSP